MKKPSIVFVTTATICCKTAEENLGLGYLSAACRKNGVDLIIIDGWLENLTSEEITNKILAEPKPVFIGFSCNQLNGNTAMEVVKNLKSKEYTVPFVAGGFGPTFYPNKFLDAGFDFVSISEGEAMIMDLYNYCLYGKPNINQISGLCYYDQQNNLVRNKSTCILDLDELPFPCRDTMKYVIEEKTPVNLCTSRGCMGSCLFCSVAAFGRLSGGPRWRGRSSNNIVDEIEQLYYKGARHFKFVDDSFIEPPRNEEWCNNFADEIQKRGLSDIRLRITVRADRINDEIISALCRAGCNLYACGIENFNVNALRRMGKIANPEQNKKALDIFKKHDVYVQMGHILFDYGTTLSELKENYEMMSKYSWTICRGVFSEMFAAKGTPYTQLLYKKGLIKGDIRLMNYYYEIKDVQAKMVYDALKEWHISHMRMYNMVIEPINKPRVLSDEGLATFYNLYLDIRKQDLDFMGKVINIVEKGESPEYLNYFIKTSIEKTSLWFNDYNDKVEELFVLEGISYMADDDFFT
ncbi:MAG: B12-binding domain-containing radical SAM protein [Oscillospiraceae bacterium]|nr:B12-binding domain-containing radical SAM protein [Oscillospiraceae bacterium]